MSSVLVLVRSSNSEVKASELECFHGTTTCIIVMLLACSNHNRVLLDAKGFRNVYCYIIQRFELLQRKARYKYVSLLL